MTSQQIEVNALPSVGIIGCGWLGAVLANDLKAQGVNVLATRSNNENVEQIRNKGIAAEVLSLPAEQPYLNKHPIFKQQCLVIAITPQFKRGRVDYAEKVQQVVLAAQASSNVERIILLNSTAIYNGLSGLVDESSTLALTAEKVAVLNDAEQAVLNFTTQYKNNIDNDSGTSTAVDKRAYILRLSGLVGPNRHPGKFLLNRSMLKNPQAIVNLIHQKDAVGLLLALINSDIPADIFNGVSATQLTKKQYYEAAANALKLPLPAFEKTDVNVEVKPKIVSGTKTRLTLNYSFVHDDLLQWLQEVQ